MWDLIWAAAVGCCLCTRSADTSSTLCPNILWLSEKKLSFFTASKHADVITTGSDDFDSPLTDSKTISSPWGERVVLGWKQQWLFLCLFKKLQAELGKFPWFRRAEVTKRGINSKSGVCLMPAATHTRTHGTARRSEALWTNISTKWQPLYVLASVGPEFEAQTISRISVLQELMYTCACVDGVCACVYDKGGER